MPRRARSKRSVVLRAFVDKRGVISRGRGSLSIAWSLDLQIGVVKKSGSGVRLFVTTTQVIVEKVLQLFASGYVTNNARKELEPCAKVLGILFRIERSILKFGL